ncbi:MAG: cell envelope integrity EipB family protein [Hyphomicrobiales bacterium]|nr:cell envelope integrity EipB family protein [Hyphomicrobiales bacterium]
MSAAPAAEAGSHAAIAKKFIPHRAVYDLTLGEANDDSGITGLRGRMVFEFTGAVCEGYAVNFRFVTEIADSDGNVQVSDLRSASFEGGAAENYLFTSQTYVGEKLTDETKGNAERDDGRTTVSLKMPADKKFSVANRVYFPTEHLIEVIAAALDGKSFLEADVYDGSEAGDKVYPTATVIGRRNTDEADARRNAGEVELLPKDMTAQPRWPVAISYFEPSGSGEQTPIYELHFLLYENGVSRRIEMGYGDFSILGRLTNLEILDPPPCSKTGSN